MENEEWQMAHLASCVIRHSRRSRIVILLVFFLILSSQSLILNPQSLILAPNPVAAQDEPPVSAFWERDVPPEGGWTVGDPIALRLRVLAPADVAVTLPELPEGWGDFEVRAQSTIVEAPEDEATRTTHVLSTTVVLWSPGRHETPSTTITYTNANGASHTITAQPVTVQIESVLPTPESAEATATIEKRDLKPQAELPHPPIWPWILAGIVAGPLLYIGGRWLWDRLPRREKETVIEEKPEPVDNRPAEVIAYEELDRIAALDLPAKGAFKRHTSLVTACLRAYIERRYDVPALDRTTYELMRDLRKTTISSQEARSLLRDLFNEADLVKFAKFTPTVASARAMLSSARRFVDITKLDREMQATESMKI
jgi:hypothetical protein